MRPLLKFTWADYSKVSVAVDSVNRMLVGLNCKQKLATWNRNAFRWQKDVLGVDERRQAVQPLGPFSMDDRANLVRVNH